MLYTIQPNIHRVTVRLPENPLKSLNSYIITGGERNLIIDTGFNRPECLHDLMEGIRALDIDLRKTDIFLTHLHADHSGLAPKIATPESRTYMSTTDSEILRWIIEEPETHWNLAETVFGAEGYPADELALAKIHSPARKYVSEVLPHITTVQNGDLLPYGGGQLRCVFTPGHTPGHTCLYDAERKILFSGDHILFDITPNITTWHTLPNSLFHYMQSLRQISELPVAMVLSAHRENDGDFQQRVAQLLRHHQKRLAEAWQIIADSPGINGYDVASRMKWSIRTKDWQHFPPGQRWFAVGEALAHLNYLVDNKFITRTMCDGLNTYTVAQPI